MKQSLNVGTTSKLDRVYLQNTASGAAMTGLVYNSAGLKINYIRSDQTTATVVPVLTMTVGTWVSGGFVEVDPTNLPGVYEVGIPNAALAGGNAVHVLIFGAANMVAKPIEYQLTPALAVTGKVTAVTNTGAFSVTFDAAPTFNQAALIDGTVYLSFTSGLNQGHSSKITGGTLTGSVGALTFTTAFGQTVSTGDYVAIVTN